jgi:pimeloyl-ACP methyl ester carboxylesterase
MTTTKRTHMGWELRESGPANAEHTVLLLPGGMCSGEFYEDIMADPALASCRLIAATVPGMGRTAAPPDVTIENYAVLGGKLAADLGCDVVVGHSMGANIALEMAAAKTFSGSLVLLSPSYSAQDEEKAFRAIAKIARVPLVGPVFWALALKGMPGSMKKAFSESRREALVADMENNDPDYTRVVVQKYFDYMHRHGEVASRLCSSGVKAWTVRGADDEVAVQDDERKILQSCPSVTWVEEPEGTHMLLVEHPDRVAKIIAAAAAAA